MPRGDVPVWPSERERSLEERIVRFLGREPGQVAFNGLRRALNAHPESLTRALRRLEHGGIVAHLRTGYALADGYHKAIGRPADREFRSVASVELARGVTPEQVLGSMAGRWFGRLRWVGVYEREEDPWLVWSVDGTAGHVLLSVHGRTLRVGVEADESGPSEVLEERARELLVRGLERIPRPAPVGRSAVELSAETGSPGWAS